MAMQSEPQCQKRNYTPDDNYHIDFSPSSVVQPLTPAEMASISENLCLLENDQDLFPNLFESDQNVGDNWNFLLEGRL